MKLKQAWKIAAAAAVVCAASLLVVAVLGRAGRGKQYDEQSKTSGSAEPGELLQHGKNEVVPDSSARLSELTQGVHRRPPSADPQKEAATNKRARRLYKIWRERQEDVAAEIIPFLRDEDIPLRAGATRLLGRLETAAAEAALTQVAQEEQQVKQAAKISRVLPRRGTVPQHTLDLALGRIRARGLRGQAKVTAIARSVGLSFDDMVRLTEHVNTSSTGNEGDAPGREVVEEIVDVLYTMAQQGQNVRALAGRLSLSRAQQVKLQGASLPEEQEIKLLLDYLSKLGVVTLDDVNLISHLLGLGPQVPDRIIERLKEMQAHPKSYPDTGGYSNLFRAAAMLGDRRALPIMEDFENDSDKWLRHDATEAQRAIEHDSLSPLPPT